jgi:hypothetical protein
MKKLNKIAAIIGCVLVMLGCSKQAAQDGALTLNMSATDPAGYSKVKVEILAVDVRFAEGTGGSRGWTMLEVRPGIYDLVNLETDLGFILAEKAHLYPGRILQIRLKFGIRNSVIVNGNTFPLALPDGSGNQFSIDLKTQVDPGKRTEITLNIDIARSVSLHDNGTFSFDPLIKVTSINQFEL